MKNIAFFLSSDTLVYLCKPVLERLFSNTQVNVYIIFPRFTEERARKTYIELFPSQLGNICTEYHAFDKGLDSLVCANDWGAEIQLLIWWARQRSIKTIAIQESVVDLSLESNRYLYADVIFAQGEVSKGLMRRKSVIVTGNPRYEEISYSRSTSEQALINCNFTYGVYEDARDSWIKDVTCSLMKESIGIRISKHPRDFSNLSGLEKYVVPSGAGVIHEQLKESAFLITRFSSLIHESILMGRPVIYYNPHGENMGYDFGTDENVFFIASNPSDLASAVRKISVTKYKPEDFKGYISQHLANHASKTLPSEVIVNLLNKGVRKEGEVMNIRIFRYASWALKQVVKQGIEKMKKKYLAVIGQK